MIVNIMYYLHLLCTIQVEELRRILDNVRMDLAKELDCGPFQIASNKVLDQLASVRPDR